MSAEVSDQSAADQDARMGRAIVRGIKVALPTAVVFLTLAVWLITDLEPADAFAAALLPSVLIGVFAGGFAGVAATMD